jgi:pseudaminic acid cytidylyltransferase
MFAYIPARGGSKRIPGKNVKFLNGTPIIGHVIETLKSLEFIDNVHVSTDDQEIAEVAESYGAICLNSRPTALSGDVPGFIDLIHNDIPRYSEYNSGDTDVLFSLATAALVPAKTYKQAYDLYHRSETDLVMSAERFHSNPHWALSKSEDGSWGPIWPEMVFRRSQELPEALADAGLFYFFDLMAMKKYQSVKLVNGLLPYIVDDKYTCDVDTVADWQRLEEKFRSLTEKKEIRNG